MPEFEWTTDLFGRPHLSPARPRSTSGRSAWQNLGRHFENAAEWLGLDPHDPSALEAEAARMIRERARGQGVSAAERMLRMQADFAARQSLGMAAAYGGRNPVGAVRQAAQVGEQIYSNAAAQTGVIRAQEQMAAQNAMLAYEQQRRQEQDSAAASRLQMLASAAAMAAGMPPGAAGATAALSAPGKAGIKGPMQTGAQPVDARVVPLYDAVGASEDAARRAALSAAGGFAPSPGIGPAFSASPPAAWGY